MSPRVEAGSVPAIPLPPAAGEYYSWGRYPYVRPTTVYRVEDGDQIPGVLRQAADSSLLAYGLGRSYGDSCLSERTLMDISKLNRLLGADYQDGWIRCEAGTSLAEILKIIVPKGWFLPVTPGTKFVTVGGAIANDVHGKNHHRAGTFGGYVRKIALCRSDEGLLICGPQQNTGLFRATIGGLGLTGVIVWAEIQLKPIPGARIQVETLPFSSLQEFMALTSESDQTHEYTVAWLDCFSGRRTKGIFFRGNHKSGSVRFHSRHHKVPFALPDWLLNRLTIKLFNSAYSTRKHWGRRQSIVPYEPFFYPLDSLQGWNLLYGKRGFLQYQCVVPEQSVAAVEEMLDLVAASGMGSFLAVLKKFGGVPSPGMLSFPRPGLTLSLDFPMRGQRTLSLLDTLDQVVMKGGGGLYPAKDARMSATMFQASFPNWREFRQFMDAKFSSSFWQRVTERP